MNCPDCHCPRGEPLTVATNSPVTRCHNAFHAVAVSPARPDDFATETAKDTTPPPPSHHGAAEALVCLVCGKAECSHGGANCSVCLRQLDDGHCRTEACPRFDGESTWHENSPRDLPDPQTYKRSDTTPEAASLARHLGIDLGHRDPFDPNPRPLIPAENGWIFCAACESPQPVSGHECAPVVCMDGSRACAPGGACWFTGDLFNLSERAFAAEGRAEFAESLLCAMAFDSARSNPEFGCNVGLFHHDEDECVMCFEFYGRRAARGGGR